MSRMRVVRPLVFAVVFACAREAPPTPPPPPAPSAAPSGATPASASVDASAPAVIAASAPPPVASPAIPTLVPLADAPKPSFGVAVGAQAVYWAVYEGGDVLGVPRAGGATLVLAHGQDYVDAIAADDRDVYWSIGHGLTPGGVIRRWSGGVVSDFATAQADARSVALDGAHVYWIVAGGYDGAGGTASPELRRRARTGGTVEKLASVPDGPTRLVLDGDDVYFIAGGSPPFAGHGMVGRVPKRGGPVTTVASGLVNPVGLAVDGDAVYWSTVGPMVTPPLPVCPKNVPCPMPTVVPITDKGSVQRVAKSGGTPTTLASGLRDTGRVSAHRGVVLFEAGHAVRALLAPAGTEAKLADGGMSEVVWAGDRGYAQIGGKIVEIR